MAALHLPCRLAALIRLAAIVALGVAVFSCTASTQEVGKEPANPAKAEAAQAKAGLPVRTEGQPADPALPLQPSWPPKGASAKYVFTRDTFVSNYRGEEDGNNGGSSQLKLKGQTEFTLFEADLSKLKGKLVTGCLWHFKSASPKEPFRRVTVSSLATPWVEGKSSSYKPEQGAACFNSPELGKRNWAYPGGNLMDAAYGRGHTIWRFAESSQADEKGWQAVAVYADVVAANVAGLSHGFAAYDDVGNEWSYVNGKFTWINMPNRFCFSHEQSDAVPYLEVWTDGTDTTPPEEVTGIDAQNDGLLNGTALVSWKTPADKGGGKTLGFNVTYSLGDKTAAAPRYLIPMAGAAGEEVRMWLRDLELPAGADVKLTIAAVDSAGNVGKAVSKSIKLADHKVLAIPEPDVKPFEPSASLPEVGGLKVAVLDLLDKVPAGDASKIVPAKAAGYRGGNHIWSAPAKLVRIQAARNDAVCFQVNLEGQADSAKLSLDMGSEKLQTRIYGLDYLRTGGGNMPDACVELEGGVLPVPDKTDPQAANATNTSALVEIYVPHAAAAGLKKGKLSIAVGDARLDLAVELTVWDFTLPDKLSFIPEMNAYGTADPAGNAGFYRLAHEHRTCTNRLYYQWSGAVSFAPQRKGEGWDWESWDKQFGPLLDGSAFKDLPRKSEPLDVFYLPFNENWPMDVFENFKNKYWAESAFTDAYREGNKRAYADFASHFNDKKWHDVIFEFFLNNKAYYKEQANVGWKGSSAPWLLDEPMSQQDFWALRWYGMIYHQAVDPVRGQAKMWYRADVSRSNYDRDQFWGVMDLECLGGANPQKTRMKQEETVLFGRSYYTEYGGSNDPATSNTTPAQWCVAAWTHGASGVLPWQTIGADWTSSNGANGFPIMYGGRKGGPHGSLRLKAFRQGQQDVEYLTLLGKHYRQPRWAVAQAIGPFVATEGKVTKTSAEDAGIVSFQRGSPTDLWRMRYALGKMVSAKKPAYERVVEPMPDPPVVMKKLAGGDYVPVAPPLPPSGPEVK